MSLDEHDHGSAAMKALEFQATLNADHTLTVPPLIADQVAPDSPLRIILLFPEEKSQDVDWNRLAAEQFLKGYAQSDSIYDNV
jgi:hypothetical protein